MALSFTEGSIGGDIERVDLGELAAFYGDAATRPAPAEVNEGPKEPSGSNALPHVLMARAKGLGNLRVLVWHILPTAAPQLLALAGVSLCVAGQHPV